ncbi:MAG: hypothetical protein ACFE0J_23735 [Elainellaceae cyanobacterium]
MSIPRYLLSSAMLSGAVFCASTLPMAALDSQPVTIQVEDNPVFVGQLKELAGPYLGIATAASLGVGVMSLTMLGWSQSSGRLSQSKDEIAKLQKELQDRDALVERLKFSDARLEASGLASFIDNDRFESDVANHHHQFVVPRQLDSSNSFGTPSTQTQHYQVSNSVPTDVRPASVPQYGAKPPLPSSRHAQHPAATAMPSAQALNGFVRPAVGQDGNTEMPPQFEDDSHENAAQLNELLSNLKQVMVQVEKLHRSDSASSIHHGHSPLSSPAA